MAGKVEEHRQFSESELKEWRKKIALLFGGSLIFMGLLGILIHQDVLKLYPNSVSAASLSSFPAKVEFALRYQSLLIGWLMFNVLYVIYGRITTRAVNPLVSETEGRVSAHKMILTNSFESITISILAQLAFVAFAEPICVLKCIPFVNIVMLVGRIAFLVGYPLKRTFGMNCTLTPNMVLVAYNLYKLGAFMLGH